MSPARAALFGIGWSWLAACAAAPPPRPVMLDPLLPPPLVGSDGGELLAAVARAANAGAAAEAARLGATYTTEFVAALRCDRRSEHIRIAALAAGGASVWTAWLQGARADAGWTDRLGAALQLCADRLRSGDLEAAADAAVTARELADDGPWGSVALGWHGFTLAAQGDGDAGSVLRSAAAAAAELGGPEVARWHLVRWAALGDPDAWPAAVGLMCEWQLANPVGADPWLWRRALELAPPSAVWPSSARVAAGAACVELRAVDEANPLAAEPIPALWWFVAGHQHRRRGEMLAALAAFRRAQELGRAPLFCAAAAVGQARALQAVARSGDARAALVGGIQAEPSPATALLLAQLAAIELAEERPVVARRLLDKALAMVPAGPWPARGQALANLGVACCGAGEPETGRTHLLAARAEFLRIGDHEGLSDCLANEVVCAREFGQGDPQEAERLLEQLQRQGLPHPGHAGGATVEGEAAR